MGSPSPPLLHGFNPTLLLILNLAGTFVFGLSGGMAGVRGRLDIFGVVVLAVVVGIAGGTIRDLLIGIPPQTFRDWRYLAVAAGAGALTSVAHPAIARRQRAIDTLDAAGLGLFCVTGAALGLAHRLGVLDCIILGAVTGIGGGIVRDLLLRQVPAVLQGGLYATPALLGATIVTLGARMGEHGVWLPILAAAVCFALRLLAMRYDLRMPVAADISLADLGAQLRRRRRARQPR